MESYGLEIQEDLEFDLMLDIAEGRRCWGRIRFDSGIFDRATVERLCAHYLNVLTAVAADPSMQVASIPLLGEEERGAILARWNPPAVRHPETNACRLFEAQAAATPNRTAALCPKHSLRYRELDAHASRLAAHLHSAGVGRGDLVAVCLERSAQIPVALLAVWKTGAAYVPLDPHFPKARVDLILEDAAPRTIVTERALAGLFAHCDATVIAIDEIDLDALAECALSAARGSDLAYVLYTSGSTGKPKGVEVPHSAFTNFLLSMRRRPGLGPDDVLLSVTTLSFDIAGLEIFLPLIAGATLAIATRDATLDGRRTRAPNREPWRHRDAGDARNMAYSS